MFNVYLIEIKEVPAAIVTRSGQCYRFHALKKELESLEGSTFPDAAAAERAALRHLRKNGVERPRSREELARPVP